MPRLKQIGIDVEVNGLIEAARRSFSESENEILRRVLKLPFEGAEPGNVKRKEEPPRSRGDWTFELKGVAEPAANLKDAYSRLLRRLSEMSPDFLERLAQERSRSRRFVSRTPEGLYENSPQLARDHARELSNGWYFDTNLSEDQVAQRARVAAQVAGLRYGFDIKILRGGRLI